MVHAFYRSQLFDACCPHSVQCFERLPQLLPTLRTDSLHMVEHGNEIALTAQLAMVGNSEAVRLITDALDKVKRSAFTVQHDAFALMWLEDFLLALGQADNR